MLDSITDSPIASHQNNQTVSDQDDACFPRRGHHQNTGTEDNQQSRYTPMYLLYVLKQDHRRTPAGIQPRINRASVEIRSSVDRRTAPGERTVANQKEPDDPGILLVFDGQEGHTCRPESR